MHLGPLSLEIELSARLPLSVRHLRICAPLLPTPTLTKDKATHESIFFFLTQECLPEAKDTHAAAIAYPNAPAPDLTAGFELSCLLCAS